MDPPPAPISTISITGILKGSPLPFLNLAFLSTSNSRALIAFWFSIMVILAVVPPISNDITLSNFKSSAIDVAKIAPPAGPDSTNLTGLLHALKTLVKVPPEVINKSGQLKPFCLNSVSNFFK